MRHLLSHNMKVPTRHLVCSWLNKASKCGWRRGFNCATVPPWRDRTSIRITTAVIAAASLRSSNMAPMQALEFMRYDRTYAHT